MHKTKTGKVSDKWESYLPFYDTLLAPIRDNKLNLLEIGVQNGGSLETWSKYFENAENIIGCDIDENCNLLKYDDPRVKVIVGDANNANTFNKIWPATILQNKRTAKLIGFEIYDNNSTGTNNSAKYKEVPEGKNKVKNFIPWVLTHIIFIPKNIVKLKAKVAIIWLVTVKV